MRASSRWLFWLILAIAAVVRVWGIAFGLPHPNARPDEGAIAAVAGGLQSGLLNPHWFSYPPLYMWTIVATDWLLRTA